MTPGPPRDNTNDPPVDNGNADTGSALTVVLPQILSAFVTGTLFYIMRSATGGLIVPILVHALWDFSLFSHGTSKAAIVPGDALLLQVVQSALPLVLFVVLMIAHNQWMSAKEPATA